MSALERTTEFIKQVWEKKSLTFFLLFRNMFIKFNIKCSSTYVSLYLSYDIKLTLKLHFLCENVKISSLCTLCCYRCHYITLLNTKMYV